MLLLAGGYYYISRPHRLAALTGELLEEMTGATAHIDGASISLDGNIDLRGVRLTVPGVKGQGGELFAAEQVMMRIDVWQTLRGKFTAEQMILVRPVVSLTEASPGSFNFELLRKQRDKEDRDRDFDFDLPRVYVREGRLRYGEVHAGRYQSTGELFLAGGLTPDALQRRLYHFEMFQYTPGTPEAATGPLLSGQLDMIALEVKAELADFAFIDPHRNMLPRQIRKWWDLFDPDGSLPNIKFDYDPKLGPQGEVRLDGLSITLPQLSPADYKVRMTDVRGSFHFDSEKIEIRELVGRIEGLEYRINGHILGYSADAPFNLALSTKPFRIPEQPRYMVALPVPVQKGFRLLTPVGWLRISAAAVRETAGGEVAYQGSATILSGGDVLRELIGNAPRSEWPAIIGDLTPDSPELVSKGMYRKFPYELTNCRGKLTFNSDLITVNNLTGNTPGGGTATIVGTIGPPGEDAAVELSVTAVGIPFDDQLKAALPESQRKYLDMFFDAEAYERLLNAGHFVTADEREADDLTRMDLTRRIAELRKLGHVTSAEALETELAAVKERLTKPVFDLHSRGDVLVKIHRSPGPDQPIDIHLAIDLAGVNVLFEHFSYPIRVTQGRLLIGPQHVQFDSVQAVGLTGGTGSLTGTIVIEGPKGERRGLPDLKLVANGLSVGPLLYDVLGEERGQWLRQLRLTGLFDVDGRIYRSEQHDFDIDMPITLREGAAAPGSGRYTLSDVQGELAMNLAGVTLKKITAKHDEARIELSGRADWSAGKPSLSITAAATGLKFEDAVLDLISPAAGMGEAGELAELWAQRQPAGTFDAKAKYATSSDGAAPSYDVVIKPQALSFLHEGNRLALTDMKGDVHVGPGNVRLQKLSGAFDGGRLSLDGDVATGAVIAADLAIKAEGDRFSPMLRHMMPPAVSRVIEALQLTGKYELTIPKLTYRSATDAAGTASGAASGGGFDATVQLSDASGRLGLPFTNLDGRIDVKMSHDAVTSRPQLDVRVTAERVRFAERLIEELRMPLRSVPDSAGLIIPELSGRCYGGAIGGSGAANLDTGDFHLQLALSGAQLGRFLAAPDVKAAANPAEVAGAAEPAEAAKPAEEITGDVSASLSVEGNLAQPAQLRGRGDILVRNGNFGSVPLSMGLLQVTHLQLPGATRFRAAAISYYLRDGKAIFERVQLNAPQMTLDGTGALDYASGNIDVTLTTSNPNGLDLGPLTQLIKRARDQLVTIRITGPAAAPEIRVRQFNGLTQAWEDVFGQADAATP